MILYNAIRTPDGTVIESLSTHDLQRHVDKKDNSMYFVDGGLSYLRRGGDISSYTDLSLSDSDDIAQIRERFTWGSRGKDGLGQLQYSLLKDLSNDHLKALRDYDSRYKEIFIREIDYRCDVVIKC
jgi:hypothetical protein